MQVPIHTSNKAFTLKDFADLDNSQNTDALVASMEAHYHEKSIQRIKKKASLMLGLQEGDKVIDIGCGLGYDAEMLAERVGSSGSVTAIDVSRRMLQEARARCKHPNIFYKHENANCLNFADNSFDACHIDRLLVSQKNVDQVFSEAVRIIKLNGKLCITALDFGTIVMHPYDKIIQPVINYWQQLVENPYIGRQLPTLFN